MIKKIRLIGIHGHYGIGKMTLYFTIIMLLSCSFFQSKEFEYFEYDLDYFLNSDLEFKSTNECIEGKCEMKFIEKDGHLHTIVYMTSHSGLKFEPIITFEGSNLILSVKFIYDKKYYTEEKVVYAFKYNINLEERVKVKRVIFINPNK
jgi:hypothetical protein